MTTVFLHVVHVYNGRLTGCQDAHTPELDGLCRRWSESKPPTTFPVAVHFNGAGAEKDKMYRAASRMAWPDVPQAELWSNALYSVNRISNSSSGAGDEPAATGRAHLLVKLKDACESLLPDVACG